jgi:hypothetical protein
VDLYRKVEKVNTFLMLLFDLMILMLAYAVIKYISFSNFASWHYV